MPRGGHRLGAGRPKGSKQVRSSAHMIREAKASGKLMPLDFLLTSMNDQKLEFKERLSAAIAAAPYVHPRLASVHVSGELKDSSKMNQDLMEALKSLSEMARNRPIAPSNYAIEPSTLTTSLTE